MAKGKKNWISGAVKHPGALRAKAHREHMSPMVYAEKHKHDSGKTGQQARFAIEMRDLRKGK